MKNVTTGAGRAGLVAALCIVTGALAGCGTSIVDEVKQLQAETVSPKFVLQDSNSNTLSANGSLSFPATVPAETSDITLTIKNSGQNDLVVDLPSLSITMASGTEANSFIPIGLPSNPLTLKTNEVGTITMRFAPASSGTKSATVVIPTNEVSSQSFSFTVTGYSTPRPPTPTGLAVSPVTGGDAIANNTGLSISWDVVSGATSYIVTRYSTSDVKVKDLSAVTGTTVIDTGLVPGTTWKYGVVAKNAVGLKSLDPTHIGGAVSGVPSTNVTLSSTSTTKILSLTSAYCTVNDAVVITSTVDGTIPSTAWSSSNAAVATVNSTGTITAVAVGTAIITATSQDNAGHSASFTINVIKIGVASGQVGLVFYDKGSYSGAPLWRYMEAATSDQSSGTNWANSLITPTTASAIGTGKTNTAAIIAAQPLAPAAYACTSYTVHGETDWFLPSLAELTQMYTSLKLNGLGNFSTAGSPYWSSTLSTPQSWCNVYCQYFSTNYLDIYPNYSIYPVRAVRQF